jgi:hypothetical protein
MMIIFRLQIGGLGMATSFYFEKLNVKFDISKIQSDFIENTKNYPIVQISKNTFGWSITSSNGDYRDGFLSKSNPNFHSTAKTEEDLYKELESAGVKPIDQYCVPTPLFKGEIVSIYEQLKQNKCALFRIRYRLMPPGGKIDFHRDYPEWKYGVRLHIPVFTNDQCRFEYNKQSESMHMPEGSSYLVKVNLEHRAYNNGGTERVHIIADFYDVGGYTLHNKFPQADYLKYLEKKKSN